MATRSGWRCAGKTPAYLCSLAIGLRLPKLDSSSWAWMITIRSESIITEDMTHLAIFYCYCMRTLDQKCLIFEISVVMFTCRASCESSVPTFSHSLKQTNKKKTPPQACEVRSHLLRPWQIREQLVRCGLRETSL